MNVQHAIKGQLANHFELNERFHQLEQVVGRPIDRIECFDISHTMGEETVASCVIFDQWRAFVSAIIVSFNSRHYRR